MARGTARGRTQDGAGGVRITKTRPRLVGGRWGENE